MIQPLKHNGKKKTSSAVAFVGNNETSPVFQEEQKESPPPYEDTEVKYQGFSKFSVGNGKYGLKYQSKFSRMISIANSSVPISVQIIGKNRAIVTDIIIAWVDTMGIPAIQPRRLIIGRTESVGGSMIEEVFSIPCFKPVDNTTVGALGNTMHIAFNTPIVVQGKTDNSMIAAAWSENGTNVYASFIGYLEA